MQIPVLLDRSRSETLTTQLVEQLREAIRSGRIAAGARMPSSRRLAEQLDVSRNTVMRAYETLAAEGHVETRPASGIFAASHFPDAPLRRDARPASAGSSAIQPPALPHAQAPRAQNLVNERGGRLSFDFFPGRPSAALFPVKAWRRLIQSCLSHGGATGLAEYGEPAGLGALRSALASYLGSARGLVVDPGQIVIVGGVQEGISLAARLCLSPGAIAIVETPCYQGAAFVFEESGAELLGVPVDEDGLIADRLPERTPALLYLTPSHQYPTGHTLSAERRREIVAWARRTGSLVIEDDYDSDFRYEGSPLLALAATAPDCVIYLGTFSKSLGAGLRLGYMVLPPHLVDAARAIKTLLNNGNGWLEQAVAAEFLKSGSYAAHIARIRVRYRESRDSLINALRRHFGEISISGEAGGLHLLWRLPPGMPDAATLEVLGRRSRIGIYSLASGGAYEVRPSPLSQRAIVLGYASLTPRQIEQGIARLSDAVDDALDAQQIDVGSLFSTPAPANSVPPQRAPGHLASYNRQRPALRPPPPHRAGSRRSNMHSQNSDMPVIISIHRYPIKGLSPQAVSSVVLEAGKPFPQDRIFALARHGGTFDEEDPQWAKKGMFVMLMLEEVLASVRTSLDIETGQLIVTQGNEHLLSADLDDPEGRSKVEAFFHRLVPTLRETPRLLKSRKGHFMDKPDNVISLINLATVRSLEERWGYEIDPLRFRANIYVDGTEPWEEFDWIGSDIWLGGALCRVDRRNGRCSATNVNLATGKRDLDIPGSLRAAFGHKDLGVYVTVRDSGSVAVGDPVHIGHPPLVRPASSTRLPALAADRRFMCRGCYYIYEEATGLPDQSIPRGTAFADIPAGWHCPDCGSDKATFRPYVEGPISLRQQANR